MFLAVAGLNFISLELFRQFPRFPSLVILFAMASLPASGYIDTMRIMIATQSDESYNVAMILIIKIAQMMKITYFFYHRYSAVVFGQAITILTSAFVLTFLKFRYSKDANTNGCALPEVSHIVSIRRTVSCGEDLCVLVIYMAGIFVVFFAGLAVFGRNRAVDALGLIGNMLDTAISFPLFLQVVVRRNARGVSLVLVLQYIAGDIMKVLTFMVVVTPWVFVLGAYCQCCVDGLTSLTFWRLSRTAQSQPQTKGKADEEEMIPPV
jgi:hypothetical protein